VEVDLVAGSETGVGAVLVGEWVGVDLVAELDAADGCVR
jgi:hypothetical protein